MNHRIIRRILLFVSGLAFLLALFLLGSHLADYKKGAAVYRTAAELADLSTSAASVYSDNSVHQTPAQPSATAYETYKAYDHNSGAPSASTSRIINLTALRQVNPDVLGWIAIPETPLSYPLVQGTDNQFYLSHTWDQSENRVGSIYLETQCSSDFSDFNTIIYGHRMKDSSMFGSLKHYKDQEYWAEHPKVLITEDAGTRTYQIYAAFEAEVTAPIYLVGVGSDEEKQRIIDYTLAANVLNTGITPRVDDQIITLCTCTGRGYESRWVVLGVLADSQEPASDNTK